MTKAEVDQLIKQMGANVGGLASALSERNRPLALRNINLMMVGLGLLALEIEQMPEEAKGN